ncbi:MAG: MerR family transcriptional regulator [Planctomycetota bacterium]|nr:MAG: MerR family transcriptional regulator [Planctomycetota bacterium]
MRIGELARRCGVNVETLRYYERQGLLRDPRRGSQGHRDYGEEDLRRVRFIRQAKELGFTLKEIRRLLDLRLTSEGRCAKARRLAEAKIEAIDQTLRRLQRFRKALEILVARCEENEHDGGCAILDAVDAAGSD